MKSLLVRFTTIKHLAGLIEIGVFMIVKNSLSCMADCIRFCHKFNEKAKLLQCMIQLQDGIYARLQLSYGQRRNMIRRLILCHVKNGDRTLRYSQGGF